MRATIGAAAMAALSVGAAAPGSASSIPPEPQLWVIDSDGGREIMIGQSWGIDAPEWSPDGTRMVYADDGVFVADADGGNMMQLSIDGKTASEPRWSPDGRWIAYSSYAPREAPGGGLRLVTPDGAERRTLAPFSVRGLAWSPDATRLSYVRGRGGKPGSLYVIDVASGAETLVEASAALYSWTEWSPAASLIAFHGWGGELRVVASDGTGERDLSEGLEHVGAASWSPTGAEITFDAGETVYVSTADGSLRRVLVGGVTPDWSPDGTKIAFARLGDIFRIRPDGTGERRVTENHLRTDRRPAWAPTMERIALVGTPLQVLCGGFPWGVEANIVGTSENDHLQGTDGRDVIAGLEGDDTIGGRGGDYLDGGKHRPRAGDRLRGGPGYDRCRRGEEVRSCEP